MKTAILISALATTAALPKFDKLMNVETKEIFKEARASKMDHKEVVKQAMSERVIVEENIDKNGQLNVESFNTNYFEIAAGVTGCDSANRLTTFGLGTYQCWNGVYQSDDMLHAYPESLMLFKPYNGGFPFIVVFDGHGCNWWDAFWFGRMRKGPFGFPGTYTPSDGCFAYHDDSGNAVWHQAAYWSAGPMMDYDGALLTDARSNKACHRGKVGSFHTLKADVCIPWDDGKSEIITVNACDEATNSFDVEVKKYSDDMCQIWDETETHTSPETCRFDAEQFKDGFMYDSYGEFAYHNKTCFKAPVTP